MYGIARPPSESIKSPYIVLVHDVYDGVQAVQVTACFKISPPEIYELNMWKSYGRSLVCDSATGQEHKTAYCAV